MWFKHDAPVIQSSSVKVVNDGTELRINRLVFMCVQIFIGILQKSFVFRITHSDLSDYTCVARNGEGRIHHTVRVVIAGKILFPSK